MAAGSIPPTAVGVHTVPVLSTSSVAEDAGSSSTSTRRLSTVVTGETHDAASVAVKVRFTVPPTANEPASCTSKDTTTLPRPDTVGIDAVAPAGKLTPAVVVDTASVPPTRSPGPPFRTVT